MNRFECRIKLKKLLICLSFFCSGLVFSKDINLICLDNNANELSIIFNTELIVDGISKITSRSYFKEYELYTLSGRVTYSGKEYMFFYSYDETSEYMLEVDKRRQEKAVQEIEECISNIYCSKEDETNLYLEEINKMFEIEQRIENEKLKQIRVDLEIDRETLKLNGEIFRGEDYLEDGKEIEASCSIKENPDYQI